jgi:transposase
MNTTDTRNFTPKAQEALRIRAVAAVKNGMSKRQAAKLFGVSRQSIISWSQQEKLGGLRALRAKKRGRKLSASKLGGPLSALIAHLILTTMPDKHGLSTCLWTRYTIAELIVKKGGPVLSKWTVGRLLKKWGFTPQKPMKKAYEQNPQLIKKWLNEEYPKISSMAKAEHAEIHWGDETGIRSDHQTGTTYGKKGKTPVIKITGKRFQFNMISTITNKGTLRFQIYEEKFTAPLLIGFFQRLIRSTTQKPFVILDRHPVHKSRKVRNWMAKHNQDIRLFFLPGYSPEYNPTELLNQDMKSNAIARKSAFSMKMLKKNVYSFLKKKQLHPNEVANYFLAVTARYAA